MTSECACPTCVAYVLATNNAYARLRRQLTIVADAHERQSRELPNGNDKINADALRRFRDVFL